ncbi:MAG: SCO family protein [Proteobacteria bacterium]|nr:SCO family protein [Pseudomonadota bacterium]
MTDTPKRLPFAAWVIAFALAGILIFGASRLFKSSERHDVDAMPPIGEIPSFRFTTQEGKVLTKEDLLGKIWVADFVFTRCSGPCPIMTSRMAELAKGLAKARDVRLVSITVDPEHDTPAVLSEYSGRMLADPSKWIFLTGPKQEIDDFARKGMFQVLAYDKKGIPTHSTRFLVIDREGKIRKTRNLDEPELVQKLFMDIGDLLREPTTGMGSPVPTIKTP